MKIKYAAAALAVVLIAALGLYLWPTGNPAAPNLFSQIVSSVSSTLSGGRAEEQAAEFAFRRLEVDTSKPQAEACLVFTRTLDASGKTRYEDYLAIDPKVSVSVRATGERICLGGLSFNETYTVTLKTGLPAASGEKLAVDETVPVELRDRPSLVRFDGGILLPRESIAGVPVTSVNIAKLQLKLYRIGDRLLSQLQTGLIDQTEFYSYDRSQIEQEQGSVLWEGTMDVNTVKNEAVTTLVPIRDMIKDSKPGAYLLLAEDAATPDTDNNYYRKMAAQWILNSDMGLTAFQGASGLSVFVRSFASAQPLANVRLTLIARDNNILAETKTDSSGRANFDPGLLRATGGDEPVAVMAYGPSSGRDGDDFTFLDLRRPAFDLTDRGVGGRNAPGPVDAFLYTERGVYRPGETVEAVAMLRDAKANALTAPLTLVVQRPDGVEFRRIAVVASALKAGVWHWPLVLTDTAPHGRWQISAYIDPKADPVGRVAFDVADFVPQRLKVTLTPQEERLEPQQAFHIRAESRFLYGAPAAHLGGEGEARIGRDPAPFEAFKDYTFGRDNDKFDPVMVTLDVPETDEAGITTAEGNLGELAETSWPLKADINVSIYEPGGRLTTDSVSRPIHTRDVWLGLRPNFQGGSVAENTRAGLEAIAVDASGKRIARKGLHYEFLRNETYYSWYQENGEWKYQSTVRTRLVAGGTFDIGAAAPAVLAQTLPWGDYRLVITDPAGDASASYSFWSGWSGADSGDRPDRVSVASDKQTYKGGETAHIRIAPQTAGKALVVVAGEEIYSSRVIDVPAAGATVDVPVSADWGAGAYVLVTHYRPLASVEEHAPVRSVGLVWLTVDNTQRTLVPAINANMVVRPRTNVTIPISVAGLSSGEEAYVTLAAVDEGILQLTDYKTPDPVGYFYGKRRLGLGMHDDYGRLIKAEKAPIGEIRVGGDAFGGRGLAVVPTKTVALFSGPVPVVNGKADVSFAVPDFNGELRMMAIVFSKTKVGAASKPLTVRDAVVGEVTLPRFLAPNDRSSANLSIHNVEGAAGAYTAVVTASGPVSMAGIVAETRTTRNLRVGERVDVPVPLIAGNPGIATVSLALTGPGGFSVKRSWPIEVRPAQLPVVREEVAVLASGASWTAGASLLEGIVPSSAHVSVNIAATKSYSNVTGMLTWLDKYPLGCLEQTTSRAMPLLVFNDLAPLAGLPVDKALADRIQEAVDRVLDMQTSDGSFGLWGPTGDADQWLSVFAMDFLYQAKAKNYVVPDAGLKRGARFLQGVASGDGDDTARAYAFYVLAREGQANLSDLRYFMDTRSAEMKTAIAPALAGSAAAQAGDRSRANAAFARARDIALRANPATYTNGEYGSLLRDVAGATALASEGGNPEIVPALLKRSDAFDMTLDTTTTQEKAWMLRAAYELSRQRAPLNVQVNNAPAAERAGAVRVSPTAQQLDTGLTLSNAGSAPVWRTVSVQGTASAPLPAEANGLTLEKTAWTLSGAPADLSNLHQNDRVIIVLKGKMPNNFYHRMAAIDLLPAGLEIETTLSGDEAKAYPWLGTISTPNISEARDDRYVAAFDIGSRYRPLPDRNKPYIEPQPEFTLAYVARAVAEGRFAMPAADVSDMYAPAVHARTTLGTMSVNAR